MLVDQTNLYAQQYLDSNDYMSPHARTRKWKPTTHNEMRSFLGLCFLMGVDKKPSIAYYWSQIKLIGNTCFSAVMSRNRYQLILSSLHFADNSMFNANDPNRDRIYKIRPVMEYLLERFQAVYTVGEFISIDEELLLHKGQLHFK